VFPYARGNPTDADNFHHRPWKPLLGRVELPNIRLHDLRHTCATLLLTQGVHAKVVSEMLGHANISITLDPYSHVIPGLGEVAVEAMEDALGDDPGVGSVGGEEP
jgi:integrase